MLNKKTTDRIAIGTMVIYMSGGNKTTETTQCSRVDATRIYSEILAINGDKVELVKVLWNGKQIFPEKTTMSTTELCNYLSEHPKANTVKSWVNKKIIPYHKAGSAKNSPTYFIISEIEKWEKNGRSI